MGKLKNWRSSSMGLQAGSGNLDFVNSAVNFRFMVLYFREAAYAMISYIRPSDKFEFDPPFFSASCKRNNRMIIELGSGSGSVASVVTGLLRPGLDHIIATDLPEVCLQL